MIDRAGVPAARQPNERLLGLIREAGCSNAGLARRVNMCAAERGLDFRYDKTSVARWIRGQQPRGRAPEVIAEALGRKLGRAVSVDDIGMGGTRQQGSAIGLGFAGGLAEGLESARELWRFDVSRRDMALTALGTVPALATAAPTAGPALGAATTATATAATVATTATAATGGGTAAAVSPAALVEPSRDWLITPVDEQVARASPAGGPAAHPARGRVGAADVEAVTAATTALIDLDRRWGAGLVRPLVVHYLDSVVGPLLTGSYREDVGRRLLGAAARLTELAGYMAVDSGQHGLAQRYYIQALRLAQGSGDRGFGGYVLAAGMSHLAGELGNPREVVQLARAAQQGTRGRVPTRADALFLAAEARGYAQLGDREGCRRAASRALAALERASGGGEDEPVWITHFDAAYLADELAHCHRDLGQGAAAERRAEEAVSGHPEGRTRRRAIGLLVLATGRLQQGELDHACHTASEAGALLAGVRSRRGAEYFEDFRRRLVPHQAERPVREFTDRWRDGLAAHR
ncbi:transcriptional regulator [Streptomyces aidingensis]|uniref:Transcriptional regulator n=1 Tax=Streptomyces aidingensis TaxID=910347 RepID=A0A1I1H9T8_9ACTN|nr:transcriptional regulator [Streptomyces aidingensis]SFC20929.1 hypothetical protein SAMN05421773_102314 [Streptomyces aidingensis]